MSVSNENKTGIVNVRRIFLDFLQSLFYEDPVYTWRSDPKLRKIDIVNEFATRQPEIELYPKIVLTRGDLGINTVSMSTRGDKFNSLFDTHTRHVQDLASGTIILNILSRSLIEAEQIGEKVFFSLLGWRREFENSYIIKRLVDIRLGSAQVVSQNSDVRTFQVPVYIRYDKEINFVRSFDFYDVDLTINGSKYYQSTDFWIFANLVYFLNPPASGVDLTMSYYVKDTLSGVTEAPLYPADGVRTVFPFSHPIYGPYYLISGMDIELLDYTDLDIFYNYYTLYDDNITVTQEAGPRVHRQGHTYILPGYITPAEGATGYIPPFYISNAPGQVTKLAQATYKLQTGGSLRCNILKNGVPIPAYSGILVTSGVTTTDAIDVYLDNGDSLALEVGSKIGSPQNLSFTIFLDYIQ